MRLDLLKTLKNQQNLTNKQIAENTGLSEPTVSRIFAGQTDARLQDAAAIARVLGASLDDLVGIHRPECEELREARAMLSAKNTENAALQRMVDSYRDVLNEKNDTINYMRRLVRHVALALAVIVAFLLGIVAYDVLNGGIGWVRYAADIMLPSASDVLLSIANLFSA